MHDGTEPIGAGLRLLIVDDEPVVRAFLGLMLAELGFEIELLATLAEARAAHGRAGVRHLADRSAARGR